MKQIKLRRNERSINRFIENYPNQFGEILRQLFGRFNQGKINRKKVITIAVRNLEVALDTIKPIKEVEDDGKSK